MIIILNFVSYHIPIKGRSQAKRKENIKFLRREKIENKKRNARYYLTLKLKISRMKNRNKRQGSK